MKISYHWLQQFVDIKNISAQDIAKRLSLSTVEVEGGTSQGEALENVVVGLVQTVEKHPNADKLNVCRVDIGSGTVKIVCGGSNVRAGMKVALAKIGAKVRWHGAGELIELKPVQIRGVDSEGMICGSDEIGLLDIFPKKEEKEIVDLSSLAAKPGTPLATAVCLDDIVFEIDNKSLSNRPDLWGHYGIAREVAALCKKTLRPYLTRSISKGKGVSLTVTVESKKSCPRYMAVVVDGVTVGPSPEWLQKKLQAIGIRPINNVVDSTNYVMCESGQPLHAFDMQEIRTASSQAMIQVRQAMPGETLLALDGKTYTLSPDMLVIANQEKPLALAGIIGGQASGVKETTTTIVFESATFEPTSIRKTSTALGVRTDASARFEKGLSQERPAIALQRVVEMLLHLCPSARVSSAVIDKKGSLPKPRFLLLGNDFIAERVGVAIPVSEQIAILKRLGFSVTKQKNGLKVIVPLWRAKDITIPEDLIEEIVRIYGYDRIVPQLPLFSITPPVLSPYRTLEKQLKEIFVYEQRFTEVYNYSFVAPEWVEKMGMNPKEHIMLDNPIAKDRPLLRRSLKGGLLENVEHNLHRFSRVALFEIGRTFLAETLHDELPQQPLMCGAVLADKQIATPYFALASAVTQIFERMGVSVHFEKSPDIGPIYHPGRSAYLVIHGKKIGSLGEVHPDIAHTLGIQERVAITEFSLDTLVLLGKQKNTYTPIPLYPAVTRDIAFVVPVEVTHAAIEKTIRSIDPLVSTVQLFDVYEGEHVPAGKKSMAYHVIYESKQKTLETKEVDTVHQRMLAHLQKTFDAQLRT